MEQSTRHADNNENTLRKGWVKKLLLGSISIPVILYAIGRIASGGNSLPTAPTAPTASPGTMPLARTEAPFVATLAQLAANPKFLKSKKIIPSSKDEPDTEYDYGNPTGISIHNVELYIRKAHPTDWMIMFDSTAVLAENFAPEGGLTNIPVHMVGDPSKDLFPGDVFAEITDGPLKGSLLHRTKDGTLSSVESISHAVNEGSPGFNWLCDNGHVPGVKPIDTSDFVVQCQSIVKGQLLSPDSAEFPGIFNHVRVETTNGCGHLWSAWVDAQNAFGVKLHKTFKCTYDPATNNTSVRMD